MHKSIIQSFIVALTPSASPLAPSAPSLPQLAKEFEAGVPCDEAVLLPKLRALLIEHFGATPREPAAA